MGDDPQILIQETQLLRKTFGHQYSSACKLFSVPCIMGGLILIDEGVELFEFDDLLQFMVTQHFSASGVKFVSCHRSAMAKGSRQKTWALSPLALTPKSACCMLFLGAPLILCLVCDGFSGHLTHMTDNNGF